MKRTVAVLLLSILFTSQVGYYFIYTIHQHIIKEEIERELLANIPKSSLELIIAEQYRDKLEWEEKNKEFFLDGEMYDVAKIEIIDGKTYLYCINDKKEKQLLDNLVKAINKNHDNKQGRTNIKSLVIDLVFVSSIELPTIYPTALHYNSFNVSPVSSFKEINIPPPKA